MVRYRRQSKLREVGESGQAKISAARASVPLSGDAAWVCARYLAGAGVREIVVCEESAASAVRAEDGVSVNVEDFARVPTDARLATLHPASRDWAMGSLTALQILKRALREP